MLDSKKLSIFINRMVPSYVKDTYPQFYNFFKSYLQFIESETITIDGDKIKFPYRMISDLQKNLDIDSMEVEFQQLQRKEMSPNFPSASDISLIGGVSINERTATKTLSRFLKSKGTEDSIKYIFKLFYNESINISYPNDDVIKLSSSTYTEYSFITLDIGIENTIDQYYQKYIISDNGATAFVDYSIGSYKPVSSENGNFIYQVRLTDINGIFLVGEKINILNTETKQMYEAEVKEYNGEILKSISSDNGLLSSNKVIGDIKTHNPFTYVISSTLPSNLWIDLIQELVHPAGFLIFAELLLLTVVDLGYTEGMLSSIKFVDENGEAYAIFNNVRLKEFLTFEYFDDNKLTNKELSVYEGSDLFNFSLNDFIFLGSSHLPDYLTPSSNVNLVDKLTPEINNNLNFNVFYGMKSTTVMTTEIDVLSLNESVVLSSLDNYVFDFYSNSVDPEYLFLVHHKSILTPVSFSDYTWNSVEIIINSEPYIVNTTTATTLDKIVALTVSY